MDERLANMLGRGSIVGGSGSGTVDSYTDTEARFRRSILLREVQEANALRRERAAREGTGG
jgi:hypothetical protein